MQYDQLASDTSVAKTVEGLAGRGVTAEVVSDRNAALARIKELIPQDASVMNGSSTTLEQIGYIEYLKAGAHGWDNLHAAIVAENDQTKRMLLRKHSVLSDYYLGSVHALAETGEFLVASNTASQLPHVVYTSPNLIFVVSTKKIVPTLADAFDRLETHVIPLEDARMKKVYGPQAGTQLSKVLIWKNEAAFNKRTVRMLLVREDLGF